MGVLMAKKAKTVSKKQKPHKRSATDAFSGSKFTKEERKAIKDLKLDRDLGGKKRTELATSFAANARLSSETKAITSRRKALKRAGHDTSIRSVRDLMDKQIEINRKKKAKKKK